MTAEDRELAARIVDSVERACRAEGITSEREISRRLDQACPWSMADPRRRHYDREALAATVRGRAGVPRAAEVEVSVGLATDPQLAAWMERRRVEARPAGERSSRRAPEGPQTIDLFGGSQA